MDERLILGIREFNEGRYFEAHDVLEDLWQGYREADRPLLQALIHASVGFYHLENGNLRGCHSQLSKACLKMDAYMPEHWGLSLVPLYEFLRHSIAQIGDVRQSGKSFIGPTGQPRIQFCDTEGVCYQSNS